ncbi:hypothetical protein DL96DRAFT_1625490 [Flagelloscypha sp. PMI_526]|nr:hypothetical protein DL96DRAFT_1625490 [Flagelloscypha sp. PMI_526]
MEVQDGSSEPSIITMDFVGDDVYHVFQIENTLFRLPALPLSRQSIFFETLFSLPQPQSDAPVEPEPIIIPDTTVAVFERFCQWLLLGSPALDTVFWKDWMALLRFAHQFEIKGLFDETLGMVDNPPAAISDLLKKAISDVQRLQVWERFNVPLTWVISALRRLCTRCKGLTDEEILDLDPATVQIILMLRDKDSPWSAWSLSEDDVKRALPRLQNISKGLRRIIDQEAVSPGQKSPSVGAIRHRIYFLQGDPVTLELPGIRFRIHGDILRLGQFQRKPPPSFDQITDPLALEFVLRHIYHEEGSRISLDSFSVDCLLQLFRLTWALDLTDLILRICVVSLP